MYLRDYPEGGRHGLQPATRRGHIDDIDMAKSVNPSAITTEAVDAPSSLFLTWINTCTECWYKLTYIETPKQSVRVLILPYWDVPRRRSGFGRTNRTCVGGIHGQCNRISRDGSGAPSVGRYVPIT